MKRSEKADVHDVINLDTNDIIIECDVDDLNLKRETILYRVGDQA